MAAWSGDCRIYGFNGTRLHQYSSDQTVAGQIQHYLKLTGPLPFTTHDHLRGDLTNATLETVPGVLIPQDELVIITSDGVHDTVPPERIQELAVAHAAEPQRLADALVAAAGLNEFGYRDDATVAVLLRPEARNALMPRAAEAGRPKAS